MFIVFITHSDKVFEFMRISQDVIRDGAKIDDTNEEVALDENIFQLNPIFVAWKKIRFLSREYGSVLLLF